MLPFIYKFEQKIRYLRLTVEIMWSFTSECGLENSQLTMVGRG